MNGGKLLYMLMHATDKLIDFDYHLHIMANDLEQDIDIAINANDLFSQGLAWMVFIKKESDIWDIQTCIIDILETTDNQALDECISDALALYCCRKTKMRPTAQLKDRFREDLWPLFEACGENPHD